MPFWPGFPAIQIADSAVAALGVSTGSVGRKFLLSVGLIVLTVALSALLRAAAGRIFGTSERDRPRFWTEQLVSLASLVTIIAGIIAIWFDDPGRLSGALGLAAAGLAVALQRVITSFAGYLIILRGNLFTVGDRIVMGETRGDVIALGFMQTTVMEMGQSSPEQSAPPAVWVAGRQYTGRIVRITNDKIFDSPIYNYTRDFPFVWDEMHIPIHHEGQRQVAERILLEIAQKHTDPIALEARPAIERLRKKYFLPGDIDTAPQLFYRITDNWTEMSVRFISHEPGVRGLKDAMFREILSRFGEAHVEIASTSAEISFTSPLRVEGVNVS
ncbi:MAG TPA: mechanosensitive ion channel domain-containing protein [Gemmatimonadaceae bacterium]|nr:mechanosensitive ion channel domain-containing protein [Gemmatimonadaceae bacterium]